MNHYNILQIMLLVYVNQINSDVTTGVVCLRLGSVTLKMIVETGPMSALVEHHSLVKHVYLQNTHVKVTVNVYQKVITVTV